MTSYERLMLRLMVLLVRAVLGQYGIPNDPLEAAIDDLEDDVEEARGATYIPH